MTRHRHKKRSRSRCWSGGRGGKPNWRTSFPRAISCSVMRNRSHCLSQRKNKINASPLPIYGVPCIQASCVTADIPRPNMAPDSPLLGALLGPTPSDVTLMGGCPLSTGSKVPRTLFVSKGFAQSVEKTTTFASTSIQTTNSTAIKERR